MSILQLDRDFSHTFRVTEAVYKSFQDCSGDFNLLHTNESFAKEHGFNSCVMYGNILNAFLSYFIGMLLPTQEVIIHSQDISYKNPVYLNDELVFKASADRVYESVRAIAYKYTFKNNDNKIVAKGHIQIGLL
jgi:acyl dehydratase